MPQALKRKPNLVAIFPPGQFGICTHLGTFKCKKKKRMKERRQKGREGDAVKNSDIVFGQGEGCSAG